MRSPLGQRCDTFAGAGSPRPGRRVVEGVRRGSTLRRVPRARLVVTTERETNVATTYLTPGVYVEEVPSVPPRCPPARPLSPRSSASRPRRRRTTRTTRDGLKPRLVTNWTQFENLYGGFVAGRHAAALGLRLLQQRRQPRLHRAHPAHRAGDGVRRRSPCPPATARSARPSSSRPSSPTPTSPSRSRRSRRPTTRRRRAADVPPRRAENGGEAVETFPGLTLDKGDRNVETVVNEESTKIKVATKIDISQARRRPRRAAGRHLRRSSRPPPTPVAGAGQGVRRLRDGPHRASTASPSPRTSRW